MSDLQTFASRLRKAVDQKPVACGAIALFAVTMAMFGDVLATGNARMIGCATQDMPLAEAPWRNLAFTALRHGHILLWNKYAYSGCPFFSEGQVSLFYPISWLHLFLPVAISTSLIVAVQVFLAGFWMFLWAHLRGLRFVSSVFCGVSLMFSGPFFMHVYAGHLSNLAAMSWVPLLLVSADMLLAKRYASGMLLGSGALAMQVFTAQPQYTYYTLITLALYMVVNLATKQSAGNRIKPLLAMLAIGVGAVGITAVQVLTVANQVGESSRGGHGVSITFAGSFSLPPENLLTAIAPTLFGDIAHASYWGRWNFWETSIYIGATGLVLAIYGKMASNASDKKRITLLAAILGVLALGEYTPLFGLLYHYFPGFDRFRGSSKFAFDANIFVVLLAGMGIDALIAGSVKVKNLAIAVAAAALLCVVAGSALGGSEAEGVSGPIGSFISSIYSTNETLRGAVNPNDPTFIAEAGRVASTSLYIGAFVLALNAAFLWLRPKHAWVVGAIVALGIIEIFTFGRYFRATFPASEIYNPKLQAFLDKNLGDGRILIRGNPNQALTMRKPAIWGYDSFNLNRYAEFVAFATGGNPDDFESKFNPIFRPSPLLSLVRLKYSTDGTQISPVNSPLPLFPHVALMQHWTIVPGRDAIFSTLASGTVDLTKVVVLESQPEALAAGTQSAGPGPAGTVRIVRDDGDSMEIEGDVLRPCVMLITDAYAAGWRAMPLEGSDQKSYHVMPADYALRGIPLGPGRQHFVLEFIPAGFATGKAVSLGSLALYVCALGWFASARRKEHAVDTPATETPPAAPVDRD